MNKKLSFIILIVIIIGVGGLFYFLGHIAKPTVNAQKTYNPKSLAVFAQCLAEKKVIMYGAYWCPHCQKQKKDFGAAFKYINYVECTKNEKLCSSKKVEGYPTWIFPNGKRLMGDQSFEDLAKASLCPAPH